MDERPLETTKDTPVATRKKGLFLWTILTMATIGIYLVPYGKYALYPFRLLYSFFHQMAYGFTTRILGGGFKGLSLQWDGCGGSDTWLLASHQSLHGLQAIGGLLGPILLSILCFVLSCHSKASRVGLVLFTAYCAYSIFAYLDNFLGYLLIGSVGVIALFIAVISKSKAIPRYFMLILAITACTGIFSHGD